MEKLATLFQENIGGKKKTCNYELGWFRRMEGLEADIFCLLRGNQYCPDCSVDICDAQCLCWWEVEIAPLCDWVIIVSIRMVAAGRCSTPVVRSVLNMINTRCRVPPSSCSHKHQTCLVSRDNNQVSSVAELTDWRLTLSHLSSITNRVWGLVFLGF